MICSRNQGRQGCVGQTSFEIYTYELLNPLVHAFMEKLVMHVGLLICWHSQEESLLLCR